MIKGRQLVKKCFSIPTDLVRNRYNFYTLLFISAFLLLNTLKVALFNYYIIPSQTFASFSYKYFITLALITVVLMVILLLKRPVLFMLFYILQLIYIFANLAYYLYFHNYLHILQSIGLFTEGVKAAKAFSIPSDPRLVITLLDLPVFILVLSSYRRLAQMSRKLKLQRNSLMAAGLVVLLLVEALNYSFDYSIVNFLKAKTIGETLVVERYGTLVNSIIDIFKSSEEENMINRLVYGKEVSSTDNSKEKPNFVIIQVESMDSSAINLKYKGKPIAPYLNYLTENSVYYPYVLSYHMGGGTSDSEFSIINSIHPLENFPAIKLENYNYSNSLLKKLAEASYTNVAFHGNAASYFNRDIAFPKMGFDTYFGMEDMDLKHTGWGAPDHLVYDFALNEIQRQTTPFLSYIITMTSHAPFTNARHYYNNELYDDIENKSSQEFLNSISYVDKTIKEFVEKVKEKNENTYFIIFGDHTPAINTDYYKQASFHHDDKYFEFVPLFIITPDQKAYREDKIVGSFLDFAPTILRASNIGYEYKTDGINLLSNNSNAPGIPYRGTSYDRHLLYEKISVEADKD